MNIDSLLRDYARQDLRRFCPSPEHGPTDNELAGSLLSAPGLAPRERVAATALDAFVSLDALVKRTVEETTSPALDMDEEAPEGGMTFDQVRQIWARRELFRRAALVYARMLSDEQLIEHYQTPEPAPEREPAHAAAPPAPVVTENTSDAPAWTVRKPQRYNGYIAPPHRLLAAAHRDGKTCPTARDVMEEWRNNTPTGIAQVLTDGFDYYDAKGNTKAADLEAIRKAIGRMTSARQAPARAGKCPLEPTG